ncbi:MAG: hypothetical protein MZV65_37890 [Chromatiales bacterium]|nr:hypothetical protein [Chromatiales bacterium]
MAGDAGGRRRARAGRARRTPGGASRRSERAEKFLGLAALVSVVLAGGRGRHRRAPLRRAATSTRAAVMRCARRHPGFHRSPARCCRCCALGADREPGRLP